MTYSNILELYFDQDQEREERRERYEREHPEEAAIIPNHKPWTPEVRAMMEAAVQKICADICATHPRFNYKTGRYEPALISNTNR